MLQDYDFESTLHDLRELLQKTEEMIQTLSSVEDRKVYRDRAVKLEEMIENLLVEMNREEAATDTIQ